VSETASGSPSGTATTSNVIAMITYCTSFGTIVTESQVRFWRRKASFKLVFSHENGLCPKATFMMCTDGNTGVCNRACASKDICLELVAVLLPDRREAIHSRVAPIGPRRTF
jgi:hypothetical protein